MILLISSPNLQPISKKVKMKATIDFFKVVFKRNSNMANFTGSSEPVNELQNEPVNNNELKVLNVIKEDNYITRDKIAEKMALSLGTVKRILVSLKEKRYHYKTWGR